MLTLIAILYAVAYFTYNANTWICGNATANPIFVPDPKQRFADITLAWTAAFIFTLATLLVLFYGGIYVAGLVLSLVL